ncbi:hypothetical protein [Kibdelosporangium persicum]|nr:hypothetical protein [Kibdelosporangium persicum]
MNFLAGAAAGPPGCWGVMPKRVVAAVVLACLAIATLGALAGLLS